MSLPRELLRLADLGAAEILRGRESRHRTEAPAAGLADRRPDAPRLQEHANANGHTLPHAPPAPDPSAADEAARFAAARLEAMEKTLGGAS